MGLGPHGNKHSFGSVILWQNVKLWSLMKFGLKIQLGSPFSILAKNSSQMFLKKQTYIRDISTHHFSTIFNWKCSVWCDQFSPAAANGIHTVMELHFIAQSAQDNNTTIQFPISKCQTTKPIAIHFLSFQGFPSGCEYCSGVIWFMT